MCYSDWSLRAFAAVIHLRLAQALPSGCGGGALLGGHTAPAPCPLRQGCPDSGCIHITGTHPGAQEPAFPAAPGGADLDLGVLAFIPLHAPVACLFTDLGLPFPVSTTPASSSGKPMRPQEPGPQRGLLCTHPARRPHHNITSVHSSA